MKGIKLILSVVKNLALFLPMIVVLIKALTMISEEAEKIVDNKK